jgi:hypothetical protein
MVTIVSLAGGFGCGDDEPSAPPDAGARDADVGNPTDDAGRDSSVDASSTPDSGGTGGSWSDFDASFLDDLLDGVCITSVAAECDGAEDCGGDRRICCATIGPSTSASSLPGYVGYKTMQCSATCKRSEGGFPLCHRVSPDERTCLSADDTLECRRTLLLPHDFIGVCAPHSEYAPETLKGEPVSGLIECGASRCTVGTEKCCLGVTYDRDAPQNTAPSARCLPLDAECNCEGRSEPEDAGTDAMVTTDAMTIDDDAGL